MLYHHRVLRRMEALSSTTAAVTSVVSLEKFIQASYSDVYSLPSPSIYDSESLSYHSCNDDEEGDNKDKKHDDGEEGNNSNKSSGGSSGSGNGHIHSRNHTNSKLRSDIHRGQYWSALIQLYHQHYIDYNYDSNTQHVYDTPLYTTHTPYQSSSHLNTTSFSTSSGSSSGSLPIHMQAHSRLSRVLYTRLLLFMVFIVIIWVYGMYMFTTLILPVHIYTSSYTVISYVYGSIHSSAYYLYSVCTYVAGWVVYVSRAVYSSTDRW